MYKMYICMLLSCCEARRRIIGGRDAQVNEFPYVASWGVYFTDRERYYHSCTCSIISPSWSISAAHCAESLSDYRTTIKHSSHLPSVPGNYAEVLRIIPHPAYTMFDDISDDFDLKYDVCIVQTERIILQKYCTLSAVDYTTLLGHRVLTLGHGITNKSSELNDAMTLKMPLQVMDGLVTRCLEKDYNLPMTFCLMPKCGEVSLLTRGDSGGPVIHASGLVGITSASSLEGDNRVSFKKLNRKSFSLSAAGIIAAISPCMDWISEVTNSYELNYDNTKKK